MGRSGANQSAILLAAIGIMTCGLSNSMQMLIISRFVRLFIQLVVLLHATRIRILFLTQILDLGHGWWRNIYNFFVSLESPQIRVTAVEYLI